MKLNLETYDTKEINKLVAETNERRNWGYSNNDLAILGRKFVRAGIKGKVFIYNLLEDANFHTFANWLNNEQYSEYENAIGLKIIR